MNIYEPPRIDQWWKGLSRWHKWAVRYLYWLSILNGFLLIIRFLIGVTTMNWILIALALMTLVLLGTWLLEHIDKRRRERWWEEHFDVDYQRHMAAADEWWQREHGA